MRVFLPLLLLVPTAAWAIPEPVNPLPVIELRVDVRNITGPSDTGKLELSDLRSRVDAVNSVWSQCAIRFTARSTANVSAHELGVKYQPQSQGDLSQLAAALNPHGFNGAIPLTIAGPWNFYDSGSGLYLTGLGWVFTRPEGAIDRIGAMIDSQRVHLPIAGALIAHELAHALSLPHVAERDNLMGPGGTNKLTPAQCAQARRFSIAQLADFRIR